MAEVPMWFVRAGEKAKHVADFRNQGFVALGWNELGPLSPEISDEELANLITERYPGAEQGWRDTSANQIKRFIREVRIGDDVVTYDPSERSYLIGKIESEVEWRDHELARARRVNWTHRADRDSLSESARNKLGTILALTRVGHYAETALRQNAEPLFGSAAAIPGLKPGPRGLVLEDFEVLRRNPTSVKWPTLSESDRSQIQSLRQALLGYAKKFSTDLGSEVVLKPFASHPNPSGRNAQHYWSCVFPEKVANKSFSFQLFMIVRASMLEIGFGAGSATAEMNDPAAVDALRVDFVAQRDRLKALRDSELVTQLAAKVKEKGFRFRTRWMKDQQQPDLPDFASWIDHAASQEGSGAAISMFVEPERAVEMGRALGDWAVEQLRLFVPIFDAIYSTVPPKAAPQNLPPRPQLSVEWLMEKTLWNREDLERILDTLTGPTPQVILAGPPGTSKTWLAELIARFLTQDRRNHYRVVQFHPSYSYEEFIEGLRPTSNAGSISFEVKQGTVLQMAAGLQPDSDYRVLVIDEMNRANVPRVFGELLYLLEYRDRPIDLQYSSGFRLPSKLLFIGTMNTADRSIRSIDVALRRRFDVFECAPNADLLERYYESTSNEVPSLIEGFKALNIALSQQLDRHHAIGHAFLMADPMTSARLAHIWKHKIEPLIEEYFFDQPDLAAEFRLEKFWPEATK